MLIVKTPEQIDAELAHLRPAEIEQEAVNRRRVAAHLRTIVEELNRSIAILCDEAEELHRSADRRRTARGAGEEPT